MIDASELCLLEEKKINLTLVKYMYDRAETRWGIAHCLKVLEVILNCGNEGFLKFLAVLGSICKFKLFWWLEMSASFELSFQLNLKIYRNHGEENRLLYGKIR